MATRRRTVLDQHVERDGHRRLRRPAGPSRLPVLADALRQRGHPTARQRRLPRGSEAAANCIGDRKRSEHHLQDALTSFEADHARPWVAATRMDLARIVVDDAERNRHANEAARLQRETTAAT
jgi:hypothetical protein